MSHWDNCAGRRLLTVFGVALALALGGFAVKARANNHDLGISTPRLEIKQDGSWDFSSSARMTGKELGTLIEDTIGKDNYQSTTIILNTCHSAAGIGTVQGALKGSNKVIATCGEKQTTAVTIDKDKNLTGFLPSFFESIDADPDKSVDDHIAEGKKGEPRLPKTPEEEERMKRKFERYRALLIEKNKERAAEGKTPYRVPPSWDEGGREERIQEPGSEETADKPGSKKVASGTKSNHAIIFRTDGRESSKLEATKAKEALIKAGYDSVDELSPMNTGDFDEVIEAKDNNRVPNIRDDAATPSNLKKKLEGLKSKMNKDETLTVVVIGHGGVVMQSTRTSDASGAGNGVRFDHSVNTDHIGAHEIGSLLAEEAVTSNGAFLFDDYNYTRWDNAALAIQTAEEQSVSGAGVNVFINEIFLGEMLLGLSDPGDPFGYHYLPFSDVMIEEIINATDFTAGLDVRFAFGGADDFFILATEEDLGDIANGWGFGFAGMNMVFNLDGDDSAVIPEPGGLLIFVSGLACLAAVRRHWTVSHSRNRYVRSVG